MGWGDGRPPYGMSDDYEKTAEIPGLFNHRLQSTLKISVKQCNRRAFL